MKRKARLIAAALSLTLVTCTSTAEAKAKTIAKAVYKVGEVIVIATVGIPFFIAILPANLYICFGYSMENHQLKKKQKARIEANSEDSDF
jgi:hypothetical protein